MFISSINVKNLYVRAHGGVKVYLTVRGRTDDVIIDLSEVDSQTGNIVGVLKVRSTTQVWEKSRKYSETRMKIVFNIHICPNENLYI